jgi:hypothetical protein
LWAAMTTPTEATLWECCLSCLASAVPLQPICLSGQRGPLAACLSVSISVCTHQQELHDAFAGLLHERCVGLDLHPGPSWHRAGGHRLGALLHLHQAHSAVARNGQPRVVAEPVQVAQPAHEITSQACFPALQFWHLPNAGSRRNTVVLLILLKKTK